MITQKFKNIACWYSFFITLVGEDESAPTSIVSYYFDNIDGDSRMFCPLGYDEYETIVHAMRDMPEIFEAAIDTGLMCSGVQALIEAALDGWDNWECIKPAILYIMSDARLNGFVSIENRFHIDNLKDIGDEDEWDEAYDSSIEQLKSTKAKGYAY